MQIKKVEYRRLVSGPGFNNESIGAVAEVGEEGEDAALDRLKDWVDEKFSERRLDEKTRDDIARMESQVRNLQYEQERLERKIAGARETWNRALDFLQVHRLDKPIDIPF